MIVLLEVTNVTDRFINCEYYLKGEVFTFEFPLNGFTKNWEVGDTIPFKLKELK